MKNRKGTLSLKIGAAALASVIATGAFGTSAASADEGDAFYLLNKKNTFISFVVRADSGEASGIVFGSARVPCRGGPPRKRPQKMATLLNQVKPLEDGAFHAPWSPFAPGYGGMSGTVDGDNATGTMKLKITLQKGPNQPKYRCSTGRVEWTAKSVSEQRWKAARKDRYGLETDEPPPMPPAGAAGA